MKRFILFMFFIFFEQVSCHNILIMLPFGGHSHKTILDGIAEELVNHGHQVTFMSAIKNSKIKPGITEIFLDKVSNVVGKTAYNFFEGKLSGPIAFIHFFQLINEIRDATYAQPEVLDLLTSKDKGRKYDLMIVDLVFNEYVLPLAHNMSIPTMYISPSISLPNIHWNLNIPSPTSYIPQGLLGAPQEMTFYERTAHTLFAMYFILVRNWYLYPNHDKIIQTFLPQSPPVIELERNVSFLMTHTHPSLYPSAPHMPYTAEIACIHCKDGEKLPQELADYFDQSGKDGVIYFSLGSYTKGDMMPIEMRDKIIEAFSKVPQRILWKYEKELQNLPENIKLTKWAPQQDILAHPKLRLFITHGGGLSTWEAIYHGIPLLGFPLSADQLGNIGHATNIGFAQSLDWQTFTAEDLRNKINQMINDTRYKKNAQLASKLLKDQPQRPVERAVYWIEYVIRHKGAPHLKSAADNLNFVQYFLLDVIGLFSFCAMLVLLLFYYSFKFCLRKFFNKFCVRRNVNMKSKPSTTKSKTQ